MFACPCDAGAMHLGWEILSLLALVGLVAGFVDSIAGGGGLLALPAILATGISPIQALATNKAQSVWGTLLAVTRFHHGGLIQWRALAPVIATTFASAMLGAFVVQSIRPDTLKLVVPLLLIAAVVYFLFSPRMSDEDVHHRITIGAYAFVAPFIGFYDGFFGPGTGSFFAISLVGLAGMGLTRATAHTKVLNATSNLASLILFALAGHVVLLVGAVMAVGQVAGGWLGAHYAVRHGARLIRPLLVLMSLGLTVKLLLDPANPLRQLGGI